LKKALPDDLGGVFVFVLILNMYTVHLEPLGIIHDFRLIADINTLTLQKISYLGIHLQDRSAPLKEKEKKPADSACHLFTAAAEAAAGVIWQIDRR
jgi:hypothetical protein